MQFGIRDGMLGVPFEERFAKAAELGFDGVELCLGGDYKDHPLFSEAGMEQTEALAADAGIAVAAFSPGAFTSYTYLNDDDDTRQEGIRKLNHLSRMAPQFGVDFILVPFFGNGKIPDDKVTDARLVDGLKETGSVAGKYGVTLAIESTLNAAQHIALVDAVGLDSVGVYYDMGNATSGGNDSVAEIERMGTKYIAALHMKDTGGNHLGEGEVDFAAVGAAIVASGYDGWLTLETPTKDDNDASNRKNLEYTKSLVTA
ncbi:sugar phosphate isomerase/epimerase [Candidatus Poribacteria bacterium]|jgi:sugar phosphate isomerase/epimerase|nr:sugar phosphate isomerase/epimerase [Candidatus Poribacteria bacterium]MBT5535394.1 sugar phosphate isomerase/epimerase [Candidatus Poribacteria bacterium]MBT5713111.1 sugar phosphate isomerase/epimerase [Candidatus Poribacteria bacterium]MBT7097122.1 sugar phosphate isomerase/epimerase [Candidatus Poribacteria bacterium]MBT7804725.1 sugar phosphate isomerase/epimerase [Candidatus Poribacteria bacterium]